MGEESSTPVIEPEALPQRLRDRPQWVCWTEQDRDGKPTKVPIDPHTGQYASTTDGTTWAGFDKALAAVDEWGASGVGFVFTDEDPLVGVDLDDCRDPETDDVDEQARDIVDRLDSYTEISPSGTGFHVILEATLPEGRNRHGDIEMYETSRFFTVTGARVPDTPPDIRKRQDALNAVHAEYVQPDPAPERSSGGIAAPSATGERAESGPEADSQLSDDELLKKARAAENGAKFDRLWDGDTSGYESHSEADMALACLLAFWTGGDASQMDRLFRRSGLSRPKWDEVHYADGSTYGEKTIERAIDITSEFYEPESDEPAESPATEPSASSREEVLEEKNDVLEREIEQLERQLAARTERVEQLEAQVADLEATVAEKDDIISALREELQSDDGAGLSFWERLF